MERRGMQCLGRFKGVAVHKQTQDFVTAKTSRSVGVTDKADVEYHQQQATVLFEKLERKQCKGVEVEGNRTVPLVSVALIDQVVTAQAVSTSGAQTMLDQHVMHDLVAVEQLEKEQSSR